MPNASEAPPRTSAVKLVSGIISDLRVLVDQQLSLIRFEIKDEFGRAQQGGSLLATGLGILIVGGVMFCGMLVHLLALIPGLPLWACYGLVAAPFLCMGAGLCYLGRKKLGGFNSPYSKAMDNGKEKSDG